MADLLLKDLNGDHYMGTQEGETLARLFANDYLFPFGMPAAKNPLEAVDINEDQIRAFMRINVRNMQIQVKDITLLDASVISFHKLLAVRDGLVSPSFDPKAYFVGYSEARQMDQPKTDEALNEKDTPTFDAIMAELPDQRRKEIAKTFTDRVCLVAFVFRARGHHYLDQYQELYSRIWQKCRYNPGMLHITFQHLATYALHAIFPVILDDFWKHAVTNSRVNGALLKRFDVAVAGMAGPIVLQQGIRDLLMIAPGIKDRLDEAMRYLDNINLQLAGHRFNGSVNARYYGAIRIPIDEKKLGAIAATLKAALNALAPDAPLGQSPALIRIATNAPITGAVLGRAIGNIANREEVINPLLEIHEVPNE
jgi:hypothetical protein